VLLLLAITWLAASLALGSQSITYPFFGMTHTDRTETSPRPLRIHVLTIDLGNPSVSFLVTPQSGPRDTLIQTTPQFLTTHSAQVAVNAHFFTPFPDDGTGTTSLVGLAASSATLGPHGHAYAPFERNLGGAFQNDLPALNLGADNTATIVYQAPSDVTGYVTDPPVTLYNAVSGNEQLVRNGLDVSGTTAFDFTLNPRTAIGIAPGNWPVLCTVDGRQPGVSEGVTTSELATLLVSDYGVTDAINLDGGGSTTLVFADPAPRLVNVPVGVNNVPGSERLVGSSLAMFAVPCSAPTSPACAMTVAAEGARYLAVTPPAGLAAVALKVEAQGLSCLPKYIDATGRLVAAPVFQSSAQWGTIHVSDRAIIPAVDYAITAEAAGVGPIVSASARTAAWGNADGLDDITVFDIICVLDGSQNIFTGCSLRSVDQGAGVADGVIDMSDITATLDAFSGAAYPDPDPCTGGGSEP
jgi:Phosphodiester glycosidase